MLGMSSLQVGSAAFTNTTRSVRVQPLQRRCGRQHHQVAVASLFGAAKQTEEQKPEQGQATAPIPSKSPGSFLNNLGPLPLVAVGAVVLWGLVRSFFVWKSVTTIKVPEETTKAVELADSVAKSPKLDQLFSQMDLNKDGKIDVKDVALAMKSINPTAPLSAARKSALDIFLLFDTDKNRYLNREEFSRFLQRFCLLSDATFNDFAEDLSKKLSTPPTLDAEEQQMAKELEYAVGNGKVAVAIASRKLDGIFSVWDEDRDGQIKYKQLQMRLENFNVPAAGEQKTKSMLTSVPPSNDMDRATFGKFVEDYAKASNTEFPDLADYLLVVPLHEFDPAQKLVKA